MWVSWFFFTLPLLHPALHSFPTRRSSDLGRTARIPSGVRPSIRFASSPIPLRSEEHTSELQSHSDVVCRLRLEKKESSTFMFCVTIDVLPRTQGNIDDDRFLVRSKFTAS